MKKTKLFTILLILAFALNGIAQNYTVATATKTFKDAKRANRSVGTNIFYPKAVPNQPKVQFPVIVLGHGFVMGSGAYQNFYNTLVPRGYIVVFVNTEGSVNANHDAYSKDLAFMVGAIQAENNVATSVLSGIVANKTALLGHSMGGGAATVAASLTQVETLVTFAPAKLRFDTLTPATLVKTDAVVFSGSRDGVTPPEENHIPIYNSLGSGCKYFINITGGAHCYYANSNFACDFGERTASRNISVTRVQQQATTFKFLNSWLDYKLKGDLVAKQQFSNDLTASSEIVYNTSCVAKEEAVSNLELVEVFPNPTASDVEVRMLNKESFEKVEFYNQFGQLVLTSKNEKTNVSGLKSGYYVVKVYTGSSMITKKLFVRK